MPLNIHALYFEFYYNKLYFTLPSTESATWWKKPSILDPKQILHWKILLYLTLMKPQPLVEVDCLCCVQNEKYLLSTEALICHNIISDMYTYVPRYLCECYI